MNSLSTWGPQSIYATKPVRTTDLNNGHLHKSEYKVTDLALKNYGLKIVPINSVLLAMYGGMGTIGKNAILKNEVTINQSVCAILPNNKRFNSTFLWYYTQYFRPHWEMFADSARKDPNINQEAIKRLWLCLPSLEEQNAIANYLDEKTAKIDQQIDLLSQKAKHYGELKQALINETVTRGLDKTVSMKDSGIEWIGEIPAHWEVKRLKDLALFQSGDSIVSEQIEEDDLYPVYGGNGLRGYYSKYTNDGDHILIGRQGALCGNINYASGKFWASEHAVVVYLNRSICMKWFGEALRIMNLNQYSLSAAQPGLAMDRIKRLLLPTPSFREQKAIADYLDQKTAQIDAIVETINAQIDNLKALRKTLINDVVTGKICIL